MTTQMVRKQIYIRKRQNALLKHLAKARGLSEAEIIRQAIEREVSGGIAQSVPEDQTAWQELIAFVEKRQVSVSQGKPYRWDRSEIYTERENRILRDKGKN
jgi:hypothetical protein